MAADGNQPAWFAFFSAWCSRHCPHSSKHFILFSWNFRQDHDMFSSQFLLFCFLSSPSSPPPATRPHPWVQTSRAFPLSPRGSVAYWDASGTQSTCLGCYWLKKQLFLDDGLVHSGGHGQGGEGRSPCRWPRNATPRQLLPSPMAVWLWASGLTSLNSPTLPIVLKCPSMQMSLYANAAKFNTNRSAQEPGSLEKLTWSLKSAFLAAAWP